MTQPEFSGDTPGIEVFPQFRQEIYDMYRRELAGLTDEQLDFTSDRWGWSEWSIRFNLSHVASGDFRWLLQRWGENLFTDGLPEIDDWDGIIDSPYDRRLDETKYWEVEDIFAVMRKSMDFVCSLLEAETVESMRGRELRSSVGGQLHWLEAHPNGVREDPDDPPWGYVNLEATFRHRYFEYMTHLYNIQRLKRAQGLEVVVDVPNVGYHALPDWDRSEP
jgi:hypothetical protein